MIKKLKKITFQMVAGANVATILLMFLVGFSDHLNPVSHPSLSNLGLAFPVFLFINFGFLIFWLIVKPRTAIIPFLGFLVCYVPVRTYMPFNVSHDAPAGAIKVLSYNVWLFDTWDFPEGGPNAIVEYIVDQKADIVCLQESMISGDANTNYLDSVMSKSYRYHDITRDKPGGDCISLYSKFPILSRERIKYKSEGNMSMGYKLKIGGDTVLVVNNHLESTKLSEEDKSHFKSLVKGSLGGDTAKIESHVIYKKLSDATAVRAPQAETVARYIRQHRGMSVICCGDFNDSPISYARRTIAKDLTDCYIATGNGPGISYHRNAFYVRIDNIMCSDDWEPFGCKVDSKIKSSDHYPIYCWLKKRPKP